MSVRVVVSDDEVTAAHAMKLAYEGGLESGYVEPTESGLRFNPAYLNPGTRFAVAYDEDRPIGALVLVEDGPFGLPSDRAFAEELDTLRSEGASLFEASGWVVVKEWRRTFRLGAMLFAAALRLSLAAGVERRMVIVVEPNRVRGVAGIFPPALTTESRPYLNLPGVMLATTASSTWVDFYQASATGTSSCRAVAGRFLEAFPEWLQVGRSGPHWTNTLLPQLVNESGIEDRVRTQLELIRGTYLRVSPALTAATMA